MQRISDGIPRIFFYGVIRQILVAKNKKLANITEEELRADPEAWEEIERFAQLEGLTLSDAIEERKKFRFVH